MSSANLLERSPLTRMWNPKLACGVTLALIFLTGAATGAVVMNLGLHNRLHQPTFDTPAGKALYFEHLQKELDLSPQQSEQIQLVLNDFWTYYRTVLTEGKQRVEQVLNDEQRKKFNKLLQQQTR